jgi:hypothetical protein
MGQTIINQDIQYINNIRAVVNQLLCASDKAAGLIAEWTACFHDSGSRLLPASFQGNNADLAYFDIYTTEGILNDFLTWMNDAGSQRRYLLEKLR